LLRLAASAAIVFAVDDAGFGVDDAGFGFDDAGFGFATGRRTETAARTRA
jgi:hypothetical protein